MAKKKKNEFTLSRRGREKLRLGLRQFDYSVLAYLAVVFLCVCAGTLGPYDLGKENLNGFALWFLLLPAYLPLELLGLVGFLCRWQWDFAGQEAMLLGGCDAILAFFIWIGVRFLGSRKGVVFVRTARIFVMIFVCWGIFQLLCIAALWTWRNGGFHSLHRHLHAPEEPVTVKIVR